VAGIAQRRAKGGGMLNRHGEEERGRGGAGLVGKLACLGRLKEMGQVANGPVKKKELKFEFQN
jgi:hypothetical protein